MSLPKLLTPSIEVEQRKNLVGRSGFVCLQDTGDVGDMSDYAFGSSVSADQLIERRISVALGKPPSTGICQQGDVGVRGALEAQQILQVSLLRG